MKKPKIGVIGIGKLGLPFALNLERAGYSVTGVDLSRDYVNMINEKTYTTEEPEVENLLKASKNFIATTDISEILYTDIVFVLVPTPSLPEGGYDHTFVDNAIDNLLDAYWEQFSNFYQGLSKEKPVVKDIVIGCTTMPTYCDSLANSQSMKHSKIRVSYNPEFIAQGTIIRDQSQPDIVLIGEADKDAGDIITEISLSIVKKKSEPTVHRMTRTEAEITKLALNCFLTTKIAYANMVGDVAKAAGVDSSVILEAIGCDSRIGSKYLKYGYGFGGPCFPRDNRAFGMFSESVGIKSTISSATDQSNKDHLENQVNFVKKKYPVGKTICFHYLTYKPESTLLVESQQLMYAQRLSQEGYTVVVQERPSVIQELKKNPLNENFIYHEQTES